MSRSAVELNWLILIYQFINHGLRQSDAISDKQGHFGGGNGDEGGHHWNCKVVEAIILGASFNLYNLGISNELIKMARVLKLLEIFACIPILAEGVLVIYH